MRALAHPLRLRIFELLAESPKSVSEVAEKLRQPRTRLYHHVKALERAGLLRLKETRKIQGSIEKWYEAVSRSAAVAKSKNTIRGTRGARKSAERALATAAVDQLREDVLAALSEKSSAASPFMFRFKLTAAQSRSAEMHTRLLQFFKTFNADFVMQDEEVDDRARWIVSIALVPDPRR